VPAEEKEKKKRRKKEGGNQSDVSARASGVGVAERDGKKTGKRERSSGIKGKGQIGTSKRICQPCPGEGGPRGGVRSWRRALEGKKKEKDARIGDLF